MWFLFKKNKRGYEDFSLTCFLLSFFEVVVYVVEQVEADPADGLLPHDRLVQNATEDVRDDGGGMLDRLAHRDQLLHLQKINGHKL